MRTRRIDRTVRITVVALAGAAAPAAPLDQDAAALGEQLRDKASEYLLSKQDEHSGGWAVAPNGPNFPAIPSLVLTGLLDHPGIDASDERLARGVAYVLGFQQPDGGIYDQILPSYNTSISLSMLARVNTPEARSAIEKARTFVLGLQYSEVAQNDGPAGATTARLGPEHPYYGGVGYGSHSRPDASNLHFFMQALEDTGFSHEDAAVQRAIVFLSRTQMLDETNDMAFADGSSQGGFIYSTGPSPEAAGEGESKAGFIEETLDDGTKVSRLRAYGSMTYAGFKSYAYARLEADDPRVIAAKRWMRENYTLEENPGVGTNGLYYYYLTFARGLDATGEAVLEVSSEAGEPVERDWAADLIERLAGLQNDDGSFRSVDERWMENNPVLITAYSLIALNEALD